MKFEVRDEPASDAEGALAQRVRELRMARGWSQEDLAARMRERGFNWHQTTAAKTESASRPVRLNEAQALADALRVPLAHLVVVEDPSFSEERQRLLRRSAEWQRRAAAADARVEEAQRALQAAQSHLAQMEKEASEAWREVSQALDELEANEDQQGQSEADRG